MEARDFFIRYGWIILVLLLVVLSKVILRVLFGMIIVPQNRIGLVTK